MACLRSQRIDQIHKFVELERETQSFSLHNTHTKLFREFIIDSHRVVDYQVPVLGCESKRYAGFRRFVEHRFLSVFRVMKGYLRTWFQVQGTRSFIYFAGFIRHNTKPPKEVRSSLLSNQLRVDRMEAIDINANLTDV
jgi:hypothetical protein